MRAQKGITLVALIITIVVLLIIAVVTIGAVTDSHIIGHAQNAGDSYNTAKAGETTNITTAETILNNIVANIAD